MIPTSTDLSLAYEAEGEIKQLPQLDVTTHHTLHEGVYTRSITMVEGQVLVGALIKIPTTLIVNGHMTLLIGDKVHEVNGLSCIAAAANRKQVMFAIGDTTLTMIFATKATTIAEAEEEFTHEANNLMSRLPDAVNIT